MSLPMMGEEIDIDRPGQQHRDPEGWIGLEPHVKDADRARHVRADAGIHETRKQRHAHQLEKARLGIGP